MDQQWYARLLGYTVLILAVAAITSLWYS